MVRAKLNYDIESEIPLYTSPSLFKEKLPAKNIKCRNTQCATCNILTSRAGYYSNQRNTYHAITDVYSCDTKGAIYLLECTLCHKQYVGETGTTVRNRMKHHRNAVQAKLNRPIYTHLQKHRGDFNTFKLTIVDQESNLVLRKQKEREYIQTLKTKIPFGLNVLH